METKQEKLSLYQKLHDIQTKVIGLGKDKKSNTYEYVTGGKVLEHIKPLMNARGLILKQEVLSIDNERMDYKTGVGTTYEKPKSEILSKVMMRFTWVDVETGDSDENLFGANGQNDWEKGLGSALTYGERYFLLKYFHIATDDDDIDNPDRKPEDKTPTNTTPPSNNPPPAELPWLNEKDKESWDKVVAALKGGGYEMRQVRLKYRVSKDAEQKLVTQAGLVTDANK